MSDLKCPFPDCSTQMMPAGKNEPAGIELVDDEVFLCRGCGRLVFQCVADDCESLNRPFSHFCRRCGKTQIPATGSTMITRWEEVQRFDFAWTFSEGSPSVSGRTYSRSCAESIVHHLDAPGAIKGSRTPKVLIEWAFIDGLLAIHQGGGFLALVHPFGDRVENPVLWTRPEEELLLELPFADEGRADIFRPFVPTVTADRKYAIFSTPYAVFSVQLGSLPGWHYRAETHASVAWSNELLQEDLWLAAKPVVLNKVVTSSRRETRPERESTTNAIGLLLHEAKTSRYSWQIVELDQNPSNTDTGTPRPIPLPVTGNPAQILSFRDQYLVFATPVGHWLWSTEDARRGDVSTILHLSAPEGRNDIRLDAEVETRSVFSWRYQHLLKTQENDGTGRRDDSIQPFELWYWVGRYTVERRQVRPGNAEATRTQSINFHDRPARPLGDSVAVDDPTAREMLFLVDSAGELFRRPTNGDDPRPIGNIQTGRMTEIHGLRFYDPLLVVVRQDSSNGRLQEVELRSLRYPDRRAIVDGLSLKADPLPWSSFLFTCEEVDGRLAIVRREFLVDRQKVRTGRKKS